MATAAVTREETISHTPYLIKKYECTTGITAGTITHNGPAVVPSMMWTQANNAAAADTANSVHTGTTTTFKIVSEDDGNDTFDVFCLWVPQGAGGIS